MCSKPAVITGNWKSRKVWLDGYELFPYTSQKVRNHSPDGFNWGYGGSGPAQLALALLLHLEGELFSRQHYQDFKWEVIARLPQSDFEIPFETVQKWIDSRKEAQP